MRREIAEDVLMSILALAFFLNMLILWGVLMDVAPLVEWLFALGWIVLGAGAVLVTLSIVTLRRKGTSHVIDSGVYGVVRHPMYLGGLVMFISHIFFGQNWAVAVNTVVGVCCCYLLISSEDQRIGERYGDEYTRYRQKVPKMNLVAGIMRSLRRRRHQ